MASWLSVRGLPSLLVILWSLVVSWFPAGCSGRGRRDRPGRCGHRSLFRFLFAGLIADAPVLQ